MKLQTKSITLIILLICSLILIGNAKMGISSQSKGNSSENEEQEQLRKIFTEVKQAVQVKDFNILQKYAPQKETLYWGQCNTDTGIKLTFNNITHELKKSSENAEITAADHLMTFIETEGWTGEYPYLYFQFSRVDKKWRWLGVCYDTERSLDYRLTIGREKYYDNPPVLPRRGARVFEDIIALKVRIIEILKFKAFDALKPYAIKNKVLAGKSCPASLDRDELMKKGLSVEQAVEFMQKNSTGAKEITPDRRWSYKNTFFSTNGWTGEKSAVTFCFAEGKKGWEWTGIAY